MTELEVRAVPVGCRRCGQVLATTDDQRLFIGAIVITRPVALYCARCNTKRVWQPAPLDMDRTLTE